MGRLQSALDALLTPANIDETDPAYLPNEQAAGQGMLNVLLAANEMQPEPIQYGELNGQPLYFDPWALRLKPTAIRQHFKRQHEIASQALADATMARNQALQDSHRAVKSENQRVAEFWTALANDKAPMEPINKLYQEVDAARKARLAQIDSANHRIPKYEAQKAQVEQSLEALLADLERQGAIEDPVDRVAGKLARHEYPWSEKPAGMHRKLWWEE